jgi:general secretion pathway protein N
MKPLHFILPLAVSYLIALVVMVPARIAIERLSLPQGLNLEGVSGTLWQGQAQTLRWQNQQIGPFSWVWRSKGLLEGQLAALVELSDVRGIKGNGAVGWNGEWRIDDARLYFPAAEVGHALALSAQFSGEIDAKLTHLRFTPKGCIAAKADLHWKNGSVADTAGLLTTGDTRLRVKCVNQQWLADITQDSAQLRSKGQFSLPGHQQYRLQAELTPEPGFPPALQMLLAQGASDEKNGRYTFETSGRW